MVDHMVKFAGQGIGMSLGVSIGNKALIREIELMNYLANDPKTKVIVFYIEGFAEDEGRNFVMAARECTKPVIVIKGGKSSAGMRSVSSHTASIAGDYEVFSEVMRQYGVLEAKNELELISYCESLNTYKSCSGNNIGIITVSGGHGVLAVDKCAENGLNVSVLSDSMKAEIKENLSPSVKSIASLQNPVDLTGSAVDEDFLAVANVMVKSPDIDCLLILILPYSPGISVELGGSLSDICQSVGKPIIAYVPNEDKYQMLIEGFELNNVPVSSSIEGTVLMAKALVRDEKCSI
jgi:acetate---CoA ligase (ADP-forming)